MSKPPPLSEIFNPYHKKPIQIWYRDVAIRQQSHSALAEDYDTKERTLSTFAVGLNAVASAVIFTSINPNNNVEGAPATDTSLMAVFAGVIAALNTILQAVLKNLQYAQSAEQHQQAFRQFTQMRFRLESIFGHEYKDDEHLDRSHLNSWITEYRDLLESSPLIPQDIFVKKAAKEDAAWKVPSAKTMARQKTIVECSDDDDSTTQSDDDEDKTQSTQSMESSKTRTRLSIGSLATVTRIFSEKNEPNETSPLLN